MDIHMRMNEEAVKSREIGKMSRQRMIENQANQYTRKSAEKSTLDSDANFSTLDIKSEDIINLLTITNLSNERSASMEKSGKVPLSMIKPKVPEKGPKHMGS